MILKPMISIKLHKKLKENQESEDLDFWGFNLGFLNLKSRFF